MLDHGRGFEVSGMSNTDDGYWLDKVNRLQKELEQAELRLETCVAALRKIAGTDLRTEDEKTSDDRGWARRFGPRDTVGMLASEALRAIREPRDDLA